ncbi:MAG: FtsX-like permease family protein [Gemmatimonadales bacterium]|nr:FtsX-like permease family protein [Gemmatimonadales bacterium]
MSLLATKLRRDLWHYRGQVAATVLMMAAGIALFVSMRSMRNFLRDSQRDYYQSYRFADLFAPVRRAPRSVVAELAAIPGVAAVEPRIVAEVVVDVPGARDVVTGRLVSIPDRAGDGLNRIHLITGSYPDASREAQVVISAAFAGAHRLGVGDTILAVINGKREPLRVAAVGQSPEYVYEIRGGGADFLPDARRFGVIWVPDRVLTAAFDLTGACNDLVLALERTADERAVIERVDRILDRWGGVGAYGRNDQLSHRFVTDEIAETEVTSVLIPAIFLGVTAFMLYLVTSRLIATEREQIALLKAFGFPAFRVVAHYAAFTLVTVALGTVLGTVTGLWFADLLSGVYARFYQFPNAVFRPDFRLVGSTLLIAAFASLLGGMASVRSALRLPPAEAMRPPAPPPFHSTAIERSTWFRGLSSPARIVVRNLVRRPFKALAATLGIAFGLAIVQVSWYSFDAIELIKRVAFHEADRSDIRVAFRDPVPARVGQELARLPGVAAVELSRATPVRLRAGAATEQVALITLDPRSALRRVVEPPARVVAGPPSGLLLTAALARDLGIGRGSSVVVEGLEGRRRTETMTVVGVANELIGYGAYAAPAVVARFLGDRDLVTGAHLAVADHDLVPVERALRRFPAVTGVGIRSATLEAFDRTIAESFRISLVTILAFACLIAAAVTYNSGRISLSERARELASLRILGFTRGEVAAMLLGEQAVLTLAAIPIGAALGYGFCWAITVRFAAESFRLPLVVAPQTYLFAAAVILVAASLTGLALRRRANRLDLVAVLKARE